MAGLSFGGSPSKKVILTLGNGGSHFYNTEDAQDFHKWELFKTSALNLPRHKFFKLTQVSRLHYTT